jgi:hypothetical protein
MNHCTRAIAVTFALVLAAPRARADVAPPGFMECMGADAGVGCRMTQSGNAVGGTCLVSKCAGKAPCTDAATDLPGCADGGLPGFPGYGLVYSDCLLCNPEAGVPPTPDAGIAHPTSPEAGVPPVDGSLFPAPDAGVPAASPKRHSSGCAMVDARPNGAGVGWWVGGSLLLWLGTRRWRRCWCERSRVQASCRTP